VGGVGCVVGVGWGGYVVCAIEGVEKREICAGDQGNVGICVTFFFVCWGRGGSSKECRERRFLRQECLPGFLRRKACERRGERREVGAGRRAV